MSEAKFASRLACARKKNSVEMPGICMITIRLSCSTMHQGSISTGKPLQNCISEFPSQWSCVEAVGMQEQSGDNYSQKLRISDLLLCLF